MRTGLAASTLGYVQETPDTQPEAGWRRLSRREKLEHCCSAVAACVLLIGGVWLLPAHPKAQAAELTLVDPGWELRGHGADGKKWACTAELVGENVWITAAHCVDRAVEELVLFKGNDVREATLYRSAAKYVPGDKHSVKYDVAIVGATENLSLELRSMKDIQPEETLSVRSMQSDGLWHECVVPRADAYYNSGHWHVPCGLGRGASGSGVWAGEALVGVLSSISTDGENSLADPWGLFDPPY